MKLSWPFGHEQVRVRVRDGVEISHDPWVIVATVAARGGRGTTWHYL